MAHGIVSMVLDECIVPDAFGYIKETGPVAAQRYLVVWCAGHDDNLFADVLHGGEVMEALGNIDNQLLCVPVTRLVHETIVACVEIMQPQAKADEDSSVTPEAPYVAGLRRAAGGGQ
jgi:hypothetical protein